MTQVATFDAIAADLDGLELELLGRSYRFERRGERYWVDIEDREDGSENGEYPIVASSVDDSMRRVPCPWRSGRPR